MWPTSHVRSVPAPSALREVVKDYAEDRERSDQIEVGVSAPAARHGASSRIVARRWFNISD